MLAVLAVLFCGTVLSMPAFWARPVIGEKPAQVAQHWLDCVFTSASALTGTGLSPHELGDDFNLAGQALVLGFMQAGGLTVLIVGSVIGWRFRQCFAWGADDEASAKITPGRVAAFACVLMLVIEVGGAAAIYAAGGLGEETPERPVFAAAFHAVSAFCNNGLTLTHNSLVAQRGAWLLYAVLLPLMVLGSIGGPVLYELCRRLISAPARQSRWSRDARVVLLGTAGLIVVGAGCLFFTESTPRWQLRNPRADALGKLMVEDPLDEGTGDVGLGAPTRALRQRMQTMSLGERVAAVAFQSVSARSGGFRTVRLDEKSISPVGRLVLMTLMLVGGGLGGASGGLYIVVVAVLLGTLGRSWRSACVGRDGGCMDAGVTESPSPSTPPGPPLLRGGEPGLSLPRRGEPGLSLPRRGEPGSPLLGEGESGDPLVRGGEAEALPRESPPLSKGGMGGVRSQGELRMGAVVPAASVAVAMVLLVAATALVLVYREPKSVELCLFTAVSACTNSGLAIGTTRLLAPEGQVMVVLAMVLGRVLPLALLGSYLRRSSVA